MQCRPLRYNGDSMRTLRNLGGRAKLASFLATLVTLLASLANTLECQTQPVCLPSIDDASCTLFGPPLLKSRPPHQTQVTNTKNIAVPGRGLKAAGAA
ncbi:hypothetical protein TNCV_2664641 [Trichonephila clavipes]|nr:hypothetical protein TNCV_2664641 [Trichonephila clavipes]